ncbi:TPA: fimbrial protein [Serratia fonticola]|uniref:fimbrial protein n=1 Tax=Serratia fonticola TaxID=47917 RepID=UPI00217B276E|nr:fimbrial protein [Serratia fonticola]CAI1542733.1 PAP fimbrial minor pilin protein precursor [Serratia fonticola]CAI1730872.1 PAP fimbrial minor pilin protein precursor [Serratia fonticola]CAI1996120.1 PAP fimbrial minor pilin protein precursor [Serratia fonticola]CAI2002038.1 PAP fimbrial minor pilin protein precursor [Serratia fonticola]
MLQKITSYAIFLLLNVCIVLQVCASQPQGGGQVNMTGSIIETACAIDTDNRDQTIEMGTLPLSHIARDGQDIVLPFSIKLVNCVLARNDSLLTDWHHFQLTFDGDEDSGHFGIKGDAKGIALKIVDSGGNIARPGRQLPVADIVPNEMILNYSLQVVSNNQLLRVGDYTSTVKFKIDYY